MKKYLLSILFLTSCELTQRPSIDSVAHKRIELDNTAKYQKIVPKDCKCNNDDDIEYYIYYMNTGFVQ